MECNCGVSGCVACAPANLVEWPEVEWDTDEWQLVLMPQCETENVESCESCT